MVFISLVASTYNVIWSQNPPAYLEISDSESKAMQFFKTFGTWILLFTNMIPISLLVTSEIVHLFQGVWIEWDADLYSIEKDTSTKV